MVAQDSSFAYQVVDTMQLYEKYGKAITREAAMDEVAADYAGKLPGGRQGSGYGHFSTRW